MKLFCIFLVLFFSFQSFSKVAYVNLTKAFENTTQGKKTQKRLEKISNKVTLEMKSKESKLQKEQESLKEEMPLLSEQAQAQKISKFQQKALAFQNEAKKKEMEFQNLQNKLMSPILERLKKTAGEIAKSKSYTVVENLSANIIWVSPELNLTVEVYKAYNKRYKK